MRYISLSLFMLVPAVIFTQTEGLIASYSFNGNAFDSSSYAHHGTIINAIQSPDLMGQPDRAFLFNGEDSYITAGDAETLKIDTALSISLWFNATGTGSPASGGILVNKEGEYSLARFPDGSIRYALAFDGVWTVHMHTGVYVPLNKPTYIAFTYSRSDGQVKLYIDCNLVYTENKNQIVGDYHQEMNELRIGGRMYLDQYFTGIIDEVKIFNRALTFEEIENNCTPNNTSIAHCKNSEFQIFPNPAYNTILVSGDMSKIGKIAIYNVHGQVVKEVNNDFGEINIAAQPSGSYVVVFFGLNNRSILSSCRFIKI